MTWTSAGIAYFSVVMATLLIGRVLMDVYGPLVRDLFVTFMLVVGSAVLSVWALVHLGLMGP